MEDRKQFFSRFHMLGRRDLSMVKLAYMLAKHGHRWQKRQETDPYGEPLRYFEHCRRTALVLVDEVGLKDAETVCIALLHDGPEDTREITCEDIEYWFTRRVSESVRHLSKLPKAGYVDRLLGCGEWRSLVVKACDRLDNLRSLRSCPREKRQRKLRETVKEYYPVFDRMVRLIPDSHQVNVSRLRTLIRNEVSRLEGKMA